MGSHSGALGFRATAGLPGGLKIKIERKKGKAMVKHNFHLDLAGWRMDRGASVKTLVDMGDSSTEVPVLGSTPP